MSALPLQCQSAGPCSMWPHTAPVKRAASVPHENQAGRVSKLVFHDVTAESANPAFMSEDQNPTPEPTIPDRDRA